ncbi:Undecaprenyl-diphosphatase [hydrothermal vent metagenome]|uniref:Undecaprenyl-diphosphatase n=1 Tax=hydrothermal vent metagenome TaxID=652676 RepID=A0A3B1E3Y1_9ZZZZ
MDYSILRAIILGVIQGIAEFLPISSSGHLVIFGDLLHRVMGTHSQQGEDLHMNIALHVGTLFSILWVYRDEIRHRVFQQPRLMLGICIATLPLVAIGLSSIKDIIEDIFNTPLYAGCGLLVTALFLFLGQKLQREAANSTLKELHPMQAMLVGLFQAVAIIPGISRSGSTISAGLLCGIERQAAATFSFLIAIPAIAGAAVLMLKDILTQPPVATSTTSTVASGNYHVALWVGGITAFFVGWGSLRGLLTLIGKGRLHYFAIYCLLLGSSTIIWQLFFV